MSREIYTLGRSAIERIEVFKNLNASEILRIEAACRRMEMPANAPLLFASEVSGAVYFLRSGTVNVYRPQMNGGRFL